MVLKPDNCGRATLQVVVGSESRIKLDAVRTAFERFALFMPGLADVQVSGVKTDSGVPDQPVGMDQMHAGALNRARQALGSSPETNMGIGIENGLINGPAERRWIDQPHVFILTDARRGTEATGVGLPIPHWAAMEAQQDGNELGTVVQRLADGGEKDPHKWFSMGAVDRQEIVVQAIVCALVPILCSERYAEPAEAPA